MTTIIKAALAAAGATKKRMYEDQASGRKEDRPGLTKRPLSLSERWPD
ncbi:MAG: hypothetical protein WC028_00070 [Candidatus Obscuribacterales bacterium]